MKLFEMEGFLRGKCLPGDMKVNETGAEYLVRKFAGLEQQLTESHRALRAETTAHDNVKMQLEKMAAENAGLKQYASDCVGAVEFWNSWADEEDKITTAPETPETDAVLAEVRAQGAESTGEYLKQYAQGLHEEARLVLQDAGELCNGFAAQLRKGVQS